MNKKQYLMVFAFVFLLSVSFVSAANIFEGLYTLTGGKGLAWIYDQAPGFFDSLILSIIFITVLMISLGKRFNTRAGKAMIVTIGIALAISTEFFFRARGWNLKTMSPLAGGVLLVILAYAAYGLMVKYFGMEKTTAGATATVVTWFFLNRILIRFLPNLQEIPILFTMYSLLHVGMVIASIILVINGFKFLFGDAIGGAAKDIKEDTEDAIKNTKEWFEGRDKKDLEKSNKVLNKIIKNLKRENKRIVKIGKNKKISEEDRKEAYIIARELEDLINKLETKKREELADVLRVVPKVTEKAKDFSEKVKEKKEIKKEKEEEVKKAEEITKIFEKLAIRESDELKKIKDKVDDIKNEEDAEKIKKKIREERRELIKNRRRNRKFLRHSEYEEINRIRMDVGANIKVQIKAIRAILNAKLTSLSIFKDIAREKLEDAIKSNNAIIELYKEIDKKLEGEEEGVEETMGKKLKGAKE